MKIGLVVEDLSDLDLLERLIPQASRRYVQFALGACADRHDAIVQARSIRVDRGESLILLLDARTVDEQSIQEDYHEIKKLLTSVGPPIPVEVVFAVPELEAVFFHDPTVLEGLLGLELTQEDRIEARYIPKKVLARLLERSGRFVDTSELIRAMDEDAAQRLATHPLIPQLEALIAEVRRNSIPEEFHYLLTG